MKLVYVPMVMALVVTTTGFTTTRGPRGRNLIGKMFTLSRNSGGISFYPSYLSPTSTPWPYTSAYPAQRYKTTTARTTPTFSRTSTTKPTTTPTTQRYKTTTVRTTTTFPQTTTTKTTTPSTTYPPRTTYPQWTTAPPTRGVSVCLRYLTDYVQDSTPVIFTLSPSTTPLRLMSRSGLSYGLSFNSYSYPNLFLQPNIRFWSNIGPNIWTRLCLTVDTVKNVAQVFSGSSMSVRKILPYRYVWSGEPVIDFSGFDGQVTDVQIWNYPLRYREIYNYMVTGIYGMDENYNIVPHGVNFQDPIFPDTAEMHRMFASLFQFSNCTSGTQLHRYTPEWEAQEDSRLLCSAVQKALFEEEERVRTLSQQVRSLEKANDHLREKVKNMKRQLRQAQRETTKEQQTLSLKQLYEPKTPQTHPDQDTTQDRKKTPLKKVLSKRLKK